MQSNAVMIKDNDSVSFNLGNVAEELPDGLRRTLMKVNPADLMPAQFNPRSRIDPATLQDLMDDIYESGINYPPCVSASGVIIDGHRRIASAIELGMTEISVFVYEGSEELIRSRYVTLNKYTRPFRQGDQLQAMLAGSPSFGKSVDTTRAFIEGLLSDYELELFMDGGYSGYIVSVAKRIAKYCGEKKDSLKWRQFMRKTMVWLMTQKQQQNATAYMRRNLDAGRLRGYIEKNVAVNFR